MTVAIYQRHSDKSRRGTWWGPEDTAELCLWNWALRADTSGVLSRSCPVDVTRSLNTRHSRSHERYSGQCVDVRTAHAPPWSRGQQDMSRWTFQTGSTPPLLWQQQSQWHLLSLSITAGVVVITSTRLWLDAMLIWTVMLKEHKVQDQSQDQDQRRQDQDQDQDCGR